MQNNLTFLTLNSGNSCLSARGEVKQFVTSQLYPLVMQQGGAIPNVSGWAFRLTPVKGGAFFSVECGADIVTVGAVATTAAATAALWPLLEKLHLANYEGLVKAIGVQNLPGNWIAHPALPKQLPWLAVVLQPGLAQHPLAGFWLADFERCLAWTIIDLEHPLN